MKILLQTTIAYDPDDWHVERFALLGRTLRDAGHDVTMRNRESDASGNDTTLSKLEQSEFDQLWLMAVEAKGGLTDDDVTGILGFRESGGGVVTARDHQDLGASLTKLHSLGLFNHFHSLNLEDENERRESDDRDNPNISYPNYHSGANGDYQKIEPLEPLHDVLRTDRNAEGAIRFFPAHPHEGAVGVPGGTTFARVIAQGRSVVTGRAFNLAVAVEDEPSERGSGILGRALAASTFHHFADYNWDVALGAPSFVTDRPGHAIADDPDRLETFKDYVRNIARWLGRRNR